MSAQASVIWSDSLTGYDFGPQHPMHPIRLELTAALCRDLGLFEAPGVQIIEPGAAGDDALLTVHDRDYVAAVRQASQDPSAAQGGYGLGTDDDPAFAGIHDASARIVGGTLEVARSVWVGEARHGVNFSGGMHHAMPAAASGFCIYNDAAVAIRWLLAQGARRVAYVDLDVHHGDGVERVFWDDPRVLTVSVHESGAALFPGTGYASDLGGPGADGEAVNLPLPPGVGDAGWLRAIDAVVAPLVRAARPDVLITQHGADSHHADPLAHLEVSVEGQRTAMELMHELAHEVCDGKWVALGGGGYDVAGAVPLAWTHLTAIAAHQPIAPRQTVPQGWSQTRAAALTVSGVEAGPAPQRMGDGVEVDAAGRVRFRSWRDGCDLDDPVDRAIAATRRAAFPLHALDPWFD